MQSPLFSEARWFPVILTVQNAPCQRSAAAYDAVIDQFDVRVSLRYQPTATPTSVTTFCNIFAWDACRAMGATLPHWVGADGSPVEPGAKGAHETTANELFDWLPTIGRKFGWRPRGPAAAQADANAGAPTLAIWKSPPGKVGHVAMVVPGPPAPTGPWCAQAGSVCYRRALRTACFGAREPAFWSAP